MVFGSPFSETSKYFRRGGNVTIIDDDDKNKWFGNCSEHVYQCLLASLSHSDPLKKSQAPW